MLSLTKKTEYALIAVCHLARVGDQVVSARDIAERHAVPLPLLMNVLKTLQQSGHVRSVRGARGGYALAVPADQFTLGELIEVIEGPMRLVRCATHDQEGETAHSCDLMSCCPIRHPVQKVHQELQRFLAGVTIATVAFDDDYTDAQASPEDTRAATT